MAQEYDIILTCNYSPWSAYKGGGQKSTHMIASSLSELGFKVAVVYSKGFFEKVEVPTHLKYEVFWAFFWAFRPSMASPLRFLNAFSFAKTIRGISSKNTVLHSNGEEGAFFKSLNKKSWIHSNRFPDFPTKILKFDLKSRAFNWPLFFRDPKYANVHSCISNADKINVTSSHNKNIVNEIFGKESFVIPNGIDCKYLEKSWRSQNAKGFIYYGRMVQAKGVDTLLKAYALLDQNTKDQEPLYLYGEGKNLDEYKALARDLEISKYVYFKGWADASDIIEHMINSKACILPSREESFGNTMLETIALGMPLISTKAGSIPEVVEDQAHLVEVENPKELAKAINKLLELFNNSNEDFWNDKTKTQKEYIKTKYSWTSTAQQFLKLYGINK